jgi:hypothetical protein
MMGVGASTDIMLGSPPPSGATMSRLVAAADDLGLEVQRCALAGRTWQWETYVRYGFVCSDRGEHLPAIALGDYGTALRTKRHGREVLLVIGPDAFARHVSGEVEDIGDIGRGWLDLHALTLAPGRHAEIVRLSLANGFWDDAELPAPSERAVINVTWPPSAPKPHVLVAGITSEPLRSPDDRASTR